MDVRLLPPAFLRTPSLIKALHTSSDRPTTRCSIPVWAWARSLRARQVSDGMFTSAAKAVADQVDAKQPGASLLPHVDNLRAVSATVAVEVARPQPPKNWHAWNSPT